MKNSDLPCGIEPVTFGFLSLSLYHCAIGTPYGELSRYQGHMRHVSHTLLGSAMHICFYELLHCFICKFMGLILDHIT